MKLTWTESVQMDEVRRRIREFKGGDKDKPMVYLGFPSEVKGLVKKNILTPYSREIKRALNWYNLTDLGKQYL
jgi:hypothetical protein